MDSWLVFYVSNYLRQTSQEIFNNKKLFAGATAQER
jgi:hypothetical protein